MHLSYNFDLHLKHAVILRLSWCEMYDILYSLGKEFSSPYCRVLLTPDLSEALAIPLSQDPFASPSSSSSGTRPPSLGLLIQHLKECTDGFALAFESYQHYSKKMEAGTPLSSEDIRQVSYKMSM